MQSQEEALEKAHLGVPQNKKQTNEQTKPLDGLFPEIGTTVSKKSLHHINSIITSYLAGLYETYLHFKIQNLVFPLKPECLHVSCHQPTEASGYIKGCAMTMEIHAKWFESDSWGPFIMTY